MKMQNNHCKMEEKVLFYIYYLKKLKGHIIFMKIGFIGAGNMATAIINGIVEKKLYEASSIYVYDIDSAKLESFAERGMNKLNAISDVATLCDIIFLAVKPQNFHDVLTEMKESYNPSSIVVSIAAGISTDKIKSYLGKDAKVVRTMPNTPLMLGYGATALSFVPPVKQNEFDEVLKIFGSVGVTEVLPEEKMNEVISVNGSSPAYVYLFAKAIVDGAVAQGIEYETALNLTVNTMLGSAYMLLNSGKTPDELIKMVSSPGGTTLKALEAFQSHDFNGIVSKAMDACTRRAKELSGE